VFSGGRRRSSRTKYGTPMPSAARVVVLEAGRVVQTGTLAELRATPATPMVARLVDPQTSSTSSGPSG
jgi:ABC-type sulfate/molybdate transport systems ATPase subunit